MLASGTMEHAVPFLMKSGWVPSRPEWIYIATVDWKDPKSGEWSEFADAVRTQRGREEASASGAGG